MIRNASACFQRGMRMAECFAAYLGTTDSITGGRDLHIGDPACGVIPPISHIGLPRHACTPSVRAATAMVKYFFFLLRRLLLN